MARVDGKPTKKAKNIVDPFIAKPQDRDNCVDQGGECCLVDGCPPCCTAAGSFGSMRARCNALGTKAYCTF